MDDLKLLLSDVEDSWADDTKLSSLSHVPRQRPPFSVLRPVESYEELGDLLEALVECTHVLPMADLDYYVVRRILNKVWLPSAAEVACMRLTSWHNASSLMVQLA